MYNYPKFLIKMKNKICTYRKLSCSIKEKNNRKEYDMVQYKIHLKTSVNLQQKE